MVVARPPIRRGDVWWVDFGQPRGSAPALRHPAVVVQCNPLNASRLATVVVVGMSSNLTLATQPGNVQLSARVAGLPKDCVVNVTQVATVDRANLLEHVGSLPTAMVAKVDAGIRTTLGLP